MTSVKSTNIYIIQSHENQNLVVQVLIGKEYLKYLINNFHNPISFTNYKDSLIHNIP